MAKSLEDIITEIVKERFSDAVINSIEVQADQDSDGDPILRVTVVFDSEISTLEARKLSGLTRHVRPKIMSREDAAFPVFRFVSKRENDRIRHEAA